MYLIKPGRLFDFMGVRKQLLAFSILLLGASVVSFFVPGPKWGTDFKGGTEVEVVFKQATDSARVREAVEKSGFESPDVVTVPDQANRFLIRVQEVSALSDETKTQLSAAMCLSEGQAPEGCTPESSATDVRFSPGGDKISARYEQAPDLAKIAAQVSSVGAIQLRDSNNVVLVSERDHKVEIYLKSKGDQLLDGLKQNLGPEVAPDSALRVEWIGPKAGAQLRDAAIKSVAIALFFVMAYIAFRFDVRFAPGGIVSLAHDVIIAVGAMCITQREVTLTTVAALLTLVGYSLSDTVVVYDRIRENLGKHRNLTFHQHVNLAVSEMLGRSLLTNLTTGLSLTAFLIFGTQVIKDFAFVMLVGMVVGTYSSIYIAAPVTEWIDRRFFSSATPQRTKPSRVRAQKRADAVV